jgi:hypothetical protein
MISIPRKARPRRSPNRVVLVEPDGSPARPSALSWPSWTDDYRWEPVDHIVGTDSMQADVHQSDCDRRPETDAEWLTRMAREESEERMRIEATYQPSAEDLAEYAAWSEALDAGTLPPAEANHFRLGESCFSRYEQDAIRRGQISPDELAMMAAGMAI